MAGYISDDLIGEICASNDIVDYVSKFVQLKKSGRDYSGLCPFHNEKTPSFHVSAEKQLFHCFGCGASGNLVQFVMRTENLDFIETIKLLADRAGINIPENGIGVSDEFHEKKKRILEMNKLSARFFYDCLMGEKIGAEAREYLKNRRLLGKTITAYGLGYAPEGKTALLEYLKSKSYTEEEIKAAGLAVEREGKTIDKYRKRIMFPIIDVTGNIIAFGGRALDNEVKPKYKNSSDTPIYKKTRHVYALNFARHTCSESMILCEGYMDVIALHSAGFTNAVATLGTAITSDQARLMRNYTKKVIICYDSDEPGQKAAQKAMRVLGDVGLDVRVIVVPGSKDPDEYIKTFGKDKFAAVLSDAKIEFEYKLENVLSKYDINLAQDKIKVIEILENEISSVYSEAERDIYISMVSERLGTKVESITADVKRIIAKKQYAFKKSEGERARQSVAGYADKVNPDFARAPSIARHEETVLGLLLLFPEHRRAVFESERLSEDDFYTGLGKRIFNYIKDSYEAADVFADVNSIFTPEEVGRITKIKLSRMSLINNGDNVLDESINSLKSSMEKKKSANTTTADDLLALINKMREEN